MVVPRMPGFRCGSLIGFYPLNAGREVVDRRMCRLTLWRNHPFDVPAALRIAMFGVDVAISGIDETAMWA